MSDVGRRCRVWYGDVMTDERHRTYSEHTPFGWRIYCTCGWEIYRENIPGREAEEEADEHVRIMP